jgi:hypothetical protein
MGFFSIETAWNTLQGYECINMLRKGQMREVKKGDITGQISFIASLFGWLPKSNKKRGFSSSFSLVNLCNRTFSTARVADLTSLRTCGWMINLHG